MAYHGELEAQGVLVASDPLAPPRSATTLRERRGRLVMTDGPFAETREWLGGYFIVRCDDLDEALRLAALCSNGGPRARRSPSDRPCRIATRDTSARFARPPFWGLTPIRAVSGVRPPTRKHARKARGRATGAARSARSLAAQ